MKKSKSPATPAPSILPAATPASVETAMWPLIQALSPSPSGLTFGLSTADWLDLEKRGLIELNRCFLDGASAANVLLPLEPARLLLHRLAQSASSESLPTKSAPISPTSATEPTPPDIAPGVSLASWFGRPYPVTVELMASAYDFGTTPTGKPAVRIAVKSVEGAPAFDGHVCTVEGITRKEGKFNADERHPLIGEKFRATIRAQPVRLRADPAKDQPVEFAKDDQGRPKLDYSRAPILVADSIQHMRVDPRDFWAAGMW